MNDDLRKWPPKPKLHDAGDRSDGQFYKHRDTGRGTEWIDATDSPWVRTSLYEVSDIIKVPR